MASPSASTTSGCAAPSARPPRGSPSTGRTPRTRRSIRAITWGSPRSSRSGRGVQARTLRLAHRGDWRHAPENSIAAFTAALAIPACDGIEFDVRASADGVPVICHDATLERTHRRADRVDGLSAAALEALAVPTLAEVLAVAGRRPFLDVELKEDLGKGVVELLAGARGPSLSNAVVSSFEVAALERIGHLATAWPRWLNSHTLGSFEIDTASRLGCWGVAVQWRA